MTGSTSCYRRRTFGPPLQPGVRSNEEISAQVFSKERKRLQAFHLWMDVKLRWGVLRDRMYVTAPTGKSEAELDALLFDKVARRNRKDPYEETKYRGAGIEEVRAWWKSCRNWMESYRTYGEPFVFDFKKLLKALSAKDTAAQFEVDNFMENCAKRWQTKDWHVSAQTATSTRCSRLAWVSWCRH